MARYPHLLWKESGMFTAVDDDYYCELTELKVKKPEKEAKCDAY